MKKKTSRKKNKKNSISDSILAVCAIMIMIRVIFEKKI